MYGCQVLSMSEIKW